MPNRTRRSFNPKRALVTRVPEEADLAVLAEKVRYNGNPEHKRNPGDFGLTPPAAPRADKTLCDMAGVHSKADALSALRCGVLKGLISSQLRGGFPQNIWAFTDDGTLFEAQLDNQEAGTYHGYPMSDADPFCEIIRQALEAP